ncbi:MAG: AAA family ATPase, partial [Eubacterium sp.]|nr:AAA family ATPase [Eubacterium sp.]
MNTKENLIFLKSENKTKDIKSCQYNNHTQKYDVVFYNSSKTFSYLYTSVKWFRKPEVIPPSIIRIQYNNLTLNHIAFIGVFEKVHWHIIYENGKENTYHISQLNIEYSCLINRHSKKVFDYLKLIAEEISLKTEDDKKILKNEYDKMEEYLGEKSASAKYLNPNRINHIDDNRLIIFPFGSNSSQTKAVKEALENDLSVIEGPPGTGKTQTILNIIANLIIRRKTVEIVSNNNSATENVYEKLCKYGYGFLVAPLGRKKNKEKFIQEQTGKMPDLSSWNIDYENQIEIENKVFELSKQLFNVFKKQEELSKLTQELYDIKTEQIYFDEFYDDSEGTPIIPQN